MSGGKAQATRAECRTPAIRCHRCRHYHVTWDERAPHGCRAMGFKSREMPIVVVRRTTPDLDCLLFQPRPSRP